MQLRMSALCQDRANLKQKYENQIQVIVICLLLKDMNAFGTTANVSIIFFTIIHLCRRVNKLLKPYLYKSQNSN